MEINLKTLSPPSFASLNLTISQILLESSPMFAFATPSPFSRLRNTHRLILAVLLIYVMTLGVAMAAPMLKAQGSNILCTSTGIKYVSASGEITDAKGKTQDGKPGKMQGHSLECSLCVPSGITPALPSLDAAPTIHTLSYATRSIPAARLATLVSAPLPARGPPGI